MFKIYFVCSLSAMILKQTYSYWTLFTKEGLELKETWKRKSKKTKLDLGCYMTDSTKNRNLQTRMCNSSVIRQKGESQNGCFKKRKHAKFSKKRTSFTPWYTHVRTSAYHGVKNVCFSENLECFLFLKHPFWDSPFLSYYRQILSRKENLSMSEMNAGRPLHFLLLVKKIKTVFFSAYDNTTEDIKQRFEQTYYILYCSIQNVLAIGIKERKIEDQVNQMVPFYQGNQML